MPEVPHRDPSDTTAHYPSGEVKLHTDMDDHLDRLFAADKAEIPWFVSLYQNIHDLIKPEILPPLVITSKPVAVKSIWGMYAPKAKSFYTSTGVLGAIFLALIMIGFTSTAVQKKVQESFSIIDPNIKPYIAPET